MKYTFSLPRHGKLDFQVSWTFLSCSGKCSFISDVVETRPHLGSLNQGFVLVECPTIIQYTANELMIATARQLQGRGI